MWKMDIDVCTEQVMRKKYGTSSSQQPPTSTDAMNKFTKAATAFMDQVPLLMKLEMVTRQL